MPEGALADAGPPAPDGVRAEVIAIGDELLLGDGTDTNSALISRRLTEVGVQVVRHTAVGDGIEDLVVALQEALGRAQLVITTGGLGPTSDDRTRDAVARVAGVRLRRDADKLAEITDYFASRGRDMPASNAQQADLPEGGWWLSRVGSAPGLAIEVGEGAVLCMPGVPSEMRVMLADDVVPYARRRAGQRTTVTRMVRTSGMSESGIADLLADVVAEVEADGQVVMAFLASRGETRVKLTATAPTRPDALTRLDPLVERVVAALGTGVVGVDEEGVEHAVARLLARHGWTLAVAESITGGGVGARLVTVPGASTWFRGGLITYATEVKALLAGIDPGLLEGTGPVSRDTAVALAVATAGRSGADVGLGVVGVAGPDPVGDAPVGQVWVGLALPGREPAARQVHLPDRGRVEVQGFAASAALAALREALADLG